jgi:pyruvate-ferredoxin/flavodoxin oxidoreductase
LLNSIWDEEETKNHLPDHMKKFMAENDIQFYIINATKIAEEIGLGSRTNTIMQSAFFKIAGVIPYEAAVTEMKKAIVKSFSLKGEEIVKMNNAAVDQGGDVTKIEVPAEWKNITLKEETEDAKVPEFIKNVVNPINALKGDDLPVSAFIDREDGTFPAGTTAFEKRGIAVTVPEWIPENCIQCNQCAYVCPHAVIRPFLLDDKELAGAPEGTTTIEAKGKGLEGHHFRIQVSTLDCTGCSVCAEVCPSKEKSLVMKPLETQKEEIAKWDYISANVTYKDTLVPKDKVFKNSQFAQPLFEFSGACSGCGETPYIKLITQLYGNSMTIANATGCSSIYGGSAPATPYTVDAHGRGPAWANSLFEDNAEFGFGMAVASDKLRNRIERLAKEAINNGVSAEVKTALQEWVDTKDDNSASRLASDKLVPVLEKADDKISKQILELKSYLAKKITLDHWW